MIKDWFSNDYFDPFESEWENRPGKYKVDPNYMSMTLDDFITENKLGDDKNFKTYAAKHHIVPWSDGYDTKKLDQLLLTYKNILDYEAKRDAKAATESDSSPTGIHNPADYLPAMRVGDAYEKQTVYEDIDDDGDVDKIEIEEKA